MNCHEGLLGYGKDFFTFTVSESLGNIEWPGGMPRTNLGKGSVWLLHLQWFGAGQRQKQETRLKAIAHGHAFVTSVSEYPAETKERENIYLGLCMFFFLLSQIERAKSYFGSWLERMPGTAPYMALGVRGSSSFTWH